MNQTKAKALVLLSGGLDSMLAAKVLMESGVEVIGITFVSNFFGAQKGMEAAKKLGIEHLTVDFKTEHLEMVKKPKYGHGKNMNPCIDCHSMMLRKAKEIMEKSGFDFVATGEVLGQRPMSQNRQALDIVAEFSGLKDKLVRPLSGKLLNLTEPEKNGKIKKEDLLDISGRSRSRQVHLAHTYGLKEYPSPAGGCLLTSPEFSKKLKELFEKIPECENEDIGLLRCGRVFYLNHEEDNLMVVIGRDQADNERLEKLKLKDDVLVNLAEDAGPTALIRARKKINIKNSLLEIDVPENIKIDDYNIDMVRSEEEILVLTGFLTCFYSKAKGKSVKIIFNQ